MSTTDRGKSGQKLNFRGERGIDTLVAAPLMAVSKANAMMLTGQVRFLLENCFKDVGGGRREPIMIEMSLERGVLTPEKENDVITMKIKNFTTTFNLPLLTIIPVNSLGVNNVDITFEMEVKSSYSETENTSKEVESKGEGSFESKLGWGPLSVSIKGSASYSSRDSSTHDTHYEKSNSAKYTVNVHAGQLPVPKGVNTIIEAFTQAIQPIETKKPDNSNPSGGGTNTDNS